MSAEQLGPNLIKWNCDWADCPETITHEAPIYSASDLKAAMPVEWSGMLITSMGDGDYAAVLCPAHADSIKRMVFDRMESINKHAVGY